MTALVWLACTRPDIEKPDSEGPECVPADEVCDGVDNNCDGAVDEAGCDSTPTLECEPFDLCGDGEDDDCDGEVDEPGCVTAWSLMEGTTAWSTFATSTGRVGITTSVDNILTVKSFEASAGAVTETWSTGGRSAWAGTGATAGAVVLGGGRWVEVWAEDGTATGPPTLQATMTYNEGYGVLSASLATPSAVLYSRLGEAGLTGSAPSGESDLDALIVTRFVAPELDEYGFGEEVAWFPDPIGDGTPGVLVGAPGNYDDSDGQVYLFDGTAEGSVDVADADLLLDFGSNAGSNIRAAGDVTGDGYEDVLVDFYLNGRSHKDGIFPGPLVGTRDESASVLIGRIAVVSSVDGNDSPDVVSLTGAGRALFYSHPLTASAYSEEDAYSSLTVTSAPPEYWASPSATDVDGDGVSDLFIAAVDYDLPYLAVVPIVLP